MRGALRENRGNRFIPRRWKVSRRGEVRVTAVRRTPISIRVSRNPVFLVIERQGQGLEVLLGKAVGERHREGREIQVPGWQGLLDKMGPNL